MSKGELSAAYRRDVERVAVFGEYWGPGPVAASSWVLTVDGPVVVKHGTSTRPAYVLQDDALVEAYAAELWARGHRGPYVETWAQVRRMWWRADVVNATLDEARRALGMPALEPVAVAA